MNNGGRMVDDIKRLVQLFAPHCADRQSMGELEHMVTDDKQWIRAHDLFDRIRTKNLVAMREGNQMLEAQYGFEEICAKALLNLTDTDAPFDEDSPYFIIPIALGLARVLGLEDSLVLRIVAGLGR